MKQTCETAVWAVLISPVAVQHATWLRNPKIILWKHVGQIFQNETSVKSFNTNLHLFTVTAALKDIYKWKLCWPSLFEILSLISFWFRHNTNIKKKCRRRTRIFFFNSAQPSTTDCRLWRSTCTRQTTQLCCLSFKVPGNFKKCHISNNWLFRGTLKLLPLDDFYFYTILHLLLSSFCRSLLFNHSLVLLLQSSLLISRLT